MCFYLNLTNLFVFISLDLYHRMDEETVNRFSKFKLKEKKDEGIALEVKDIERSREECERSLLRKV